MKRKAFALAQVILLVLMGLLAACSKPASGSLTRQSWNYPSSPPGSTGLPKERPTTKVLTEFAGSSISSYNPATGVVVVDTSGAVPQSRQAKPLTGMKIDLLQSVEVGSVIVSAPTPAAPYGLMRKVKRVQVNIQHNTATLQTEAATLAEVIAGSDLTPEQVKQTKFRTPATLHVRAIPPKQQNLLNLSQNPSAPTLPETLSLSQAAELSAQGWKLFPVGTEHCAPLSADVLEGKLNSRSCITTKLWLDVEIDIGWWWWFPYLKGFGASASGFLQGSNSLDWSNVRSQRINLPLPGLSHTFFELQGAPWTIWLGVIPIVVVPKFVLGMDMGGNFSAALASGATLSSNFTSFQFNLGTPNSPVQYGFYCGNTVNGGYWGCRAVDNVVQKFEQFKQDLVAWKPSSNPLNASVPVAGSLGLGYRTALRFTSGMYLFGILGLDAHLEPWLEPRLDLALRLSATPSGMFTRFDGGIQGGVQGKLTAGVNVLGLRLDRTIYGKSDGTAQDLLGPIQLAQFPSKCWEGSTDIGCP
jgi:hypothetical protein